MIEDYAEIERLRALLQSADKSVVELEKDFTQTQIDAAKERTQYFEKLAIGSGAAIAAIVSFLGTHAGRLQPVWIMRISLVALVIAMLTSLYRNFRYPYYILAVKNLSWINAKLYQQERKRDYFQADPDVKSWTTGGPIDVASWTADVEKANLEIRSEIKQRNSRQLRLLREVKISESVCLVAVATAMISLVYLALDNF
jgi:hypothetical protein